MRKILIITFLLFLSIYARTLRAQSYCYLLPSKMEHIYKKIKSNARDTFIVYYRTCSSCSRGTPFVLYFLYSSRKDETILEVYRWQNFSPAAKPRRVFKKKSIAGELPIFKKYLASNFSLLKDEVKNSFPFRKKDEVTIEGDKEILRSGSSSVGGPFIQFEMYLNRDSIQGQIFSSYNVEALQKKVPIVGEMMKGFHSYYSKFTLNAIVDED